MILGQATGVALAVGVRVADEDASLLRSALRHQGQRICNDDFGHDDWEFKKCSVGVGRGYTWTPRISRTTGITFYLSQETGDTSISLTTRESSRDAPRYSLTPGVVYFVNAITVQDVTTAPVNAVVGTDVGVGDSRGIGCDVHGALRRFTHQ